MWNSGPRRFLALALAPALLIACGEAPSDDTGSEMETETAAAPSDQEALAAIADYWETHFNMQHPDMVASVYADSAWVLPASGGMIEGRTEVEGWLAGNMEAAPTATITPRENVVSGDYAVGIGSYALDTQVEGGESMTMSGSYLNAFERIDGEWKIVGSLSNYDAPPPEDTQWAPEADGEIPPDAPYFPELIEAYEAAFNAGDAAGVAALYADDAIVSFSNGPIVEGPAAVQESMAARMTPGSTIDIHEVGGQDLGGGLRGAGGWYEIMAPDGSVAQTGYWMNVLRTQDDGTPEIVWTVTNARPGGM